MVYGQFCITTNCDSKKIPFEIPNDFAGPEVSSGKTTGDVKAKDKLQGYETRVLYQD